MARLTVLTTRLARRAWRRMDRSARWQRQYDEQVGPSLFAVVAASQVTAAREADTYIADVLNELDLVPSGEPPAEPGLLIPQGLSGVSGNGLPVGGLLEQAVPHAGRRLNQLRVDSPDVDYLALAQQALAETEPFVDALVETILADTMRAAEEAAMAYRPWLDGYVRMIEPGACSRCAILAGKFYAFSDGFLRHPRCRCTHIPAQENIPRGDPTTDPEAYFESLSRAEQDRIFTEAGAQAIRDGADMAQVVNARRGMSTAQVAGRDVLVTSSGVRGRRRDGVMPRLMPESILAIAGDDPAERIRLLRANGYIA